ncbi:hypothetical protein [Microbacterium phyllosphaerae]|uniref:hypothetical protein n=1 Tax=Microbacterium phyllosphaerae TaxID=124798 RepID=UPI0021673429|nr:hypothetical protein [Microbacterium phyllosphaerae]MCS3442824.1 hypothetical protein [Microbacterium phyllosphaerae]
MGADGIGEIVVYALAAAQGVSVGMMLGIASGSRHRAALRTAGLLVVGVTVTAGFMLGATAPWIGPIFAIVSALTSVLTTARTLGADAAMRAESFGQRIVYVLSRRRVTRQVAPRAWAMLAFFLFIVGLILSAVFPDVRLWLQGAAVILVMAWLFVISRKRTTAVRDEQQWP